MSYIDTVDKLLNKINDPNPNVKHEALEILIKSFSKLQFPKDIMKKIIIVLLKKLNERENELSTYAYLGFCELWHYNHLKNEEIITPNISMNPTILNCKFLFSKFNGTICNPDVINITDINCAIGIMRLSLK